MAIQTVGIKGTVQLPSGAEKVLFKIQQSIPILSIPGLSIPPGLPPLPIPKLPSLPKPDLTVKFNPPKYANNFTFPDPSLKFPSLSLSIPGLSIPPGLPPLPIPKLPSLPKPDLTVKFNPPKYANNFTFPDPSLKFPSLGLSIPGLSIPPGLPPLPIPSLAKLPVPNLAAFQPYFNLRLPFPNLESTIPKISTFSEVG